LHEVVVVTPPDVLVRLLDTEVDDEPDPDDEDDDVLDPAVAVKCDPLAALLDASAEHALLGVAAAVPNEESATITRAIVGLAMSARRFLLTHMYMGTPPFSDGHRNCCSPSSTYTRKALGPNVAHLEKAAICARNAYASAARDERPARRSPRHAPGPCAEYRGWWTMFRAQRAGIGLAPLPSLR
jgi:hypothetical protein